MSSKTYHVCPDFDVPPPPTGPIRLGHIIRTLTDPCNALNTDDRVPIDKDYLSFKDGFKATRTQLREGKLGMWAQVLEGVGVGSEVSYKLERNASDEYTFDRVETVFFIPSDEYYSKSIAAPGVQRYLKNMRYRKPVYMITGMKIVRGGRMKSSGSTGGETVVKLGFDGKPAGVPVTVGPDVEVSARTGQSDSFDASTDFVFALRLRKLTCKKNDSLRDEEFNKGAMFDLEGAKSEDDPMKNMIITAQDEIAVTEDFPDMPPVDDE